MLGSREAELHHEPVERVMRSQKTVAVRDQSLAGSERRNDRRIAGRVEAFYEELKRDPDRRVSARAPWKCDAISDPSLVVLVISAEEINNYRASKK